MDHLKHSAMHGLEDRTKGVPPNAVPLILYMDNTV